MVDIERDIIDAIESLGEQAPEALTLLIIAALNELRLSIDENRADLGLLQDVARHIDSLMRQSPRTDTH